jgi:hypothetical protein
MDLANPNLLGAAGLKLHGILRITRLWIACPLAQQIHLSIG